MALSHLYILLYPPLSTSTITTGAGILPANVAKYQVCNAVLNFVIRFLEGLYRINGVGGMYKSGVNAVIGKLRKCVGTGKVPQGFGELVDAIKGKVQEIDNKIKQSIGGQTGKLYTVFSSLKDILEKSFKTEHPTHDVKNDTQKVSDYIDAVKVEEDGNGAFASFCSKVSGLFGKVKNENLSDTAALQIHNLSISAVNPYSINRDINSLRTNPEFKNYANAAVFIAVRDAATAFITELQTKAYTSYYKGANWKESISYYAGGESQVLKTKCAKIFLGCLPLYYQALTYIYWGCHDKGGGWRNLTLGGGALRSYFDSQGLLSPYVDTNKRGAHIADSALKGFSEFTNGMSRVPSSSTFTYASFAKKLREEVKANVGNIPTNCPLSALYYGASCYFQCQQITNAKSAVSAPKTIREMLYFLAALQFSPQYEAFDGYVTGHFETLTGSSSGGNDDAELALQVADSGHKSGGNTLSAADLKSYLTSTFHLAPAFIGLIQEPSRFGEPWLHSLYCNSMNLQYPSGSALFNTLSNYAYALQFQLSFLHQQCMSGSVNCGWLQCKYGKNVQVNGVKSYLCPQKDNNCSTYSPLQAFLTDKLKGFSRGHPSDPSSHLAECSGYMCHVPMGFNPNDLRAASNVQVQGVHIA
ncbi:variant erythrocyte surface antigen-1 family protein [Babesia caballi]|uniref:Variant erythrocyte surface antigen-1 family protein n=1 Tax=Babesia caballi TaxID=5871 RepID=A0AAV4LTY3_BABCB|nr:variant erythrocyte surface antigen-1 family protein [Babesia caballi]